VELSLDERVVLTVKRLESEPDSFAIAMFGVGTINKQRAIREVRARSKVGLQVMEIEERMIEELLRRAHPNQWVLLVPNTILAIDSDYEDITIAAWEFRQANVYPYLQSRGFNVVSLVASQACFDAVRDALSDASIAFITGSGHGGDDFFSGYRDLPLFQTGNPYPGSVRNKIVHFLSCGSASLLGQDLVNNGCSAFFGYDADFSFDPASSRILFDCDGEIDRALADQCTAAQAAQRASSLFQQRIADPTLDPRVVAYLQYDLAHFKNPTSLPNGRWGNPLATLWVTLEAPIKDQWCLDQREALY
jgi:hypothetical protein